jgi:hypothetical protein
MRERFSTFEWLILTGAAGMRAHIRSPARATDAPERPAPYLSLEATPSSDPAFPRPPRTKCES